jgi:acetyl esterase/lipase
MYAAQWRGRGAGDADDPWRRLANWQQDDDGQSCANIARAGVVAIPVDYRLVSGAPGTTWPAQLNDVQLAMRWVRSHASEYGIDPDHICAEGDSAGGQLALLLGVLPAADPGDMHALLPGVSPKADCVVAISGPSDLVALSKLKAGMVARLVGPGDGPHVLALEQSGSPALRARAGAAPAPLIHGMEDPQVDFSQAEEMAAALARVGTPAWLVAHPGGREMKGMTADERRVAWPHIVDFVRTERVPGPPRRLTAAEWVGDEP